MSRFSSFIVVCVCGRVCTSAAGLTLHQLHCDDASKAKSRGLPMTKETDIVENHEYCKEVQDLVNLVNNIAVDAQSALQNSNKSAGRRARTTLVNLKKISTPLRAKILDSMNKDSKKGQVSTEQVVAPVAPATPVPSDELEKQAKQV